MRIPGRRGGAGGATVASEAAVLGQQGWDVSIGGGRLPMPLLSLASKGLAAALVAVVGVLA